MEVTVDWRAIFTVPTKYAPYPLSAPFPPKGENLGGGGGGKREEQFRSRTTHVGPESVDNPYILYDLQTLLNVQPTPPVHA